MASHLMLAHAPRLSCFPFQSSSSARPQLAIERPDATCLEFVSEPDILGSAPCDDLSKVRVHGAKARGSPETGLQVVCRVNAELLTPNRADSLRTASAVGPTRQRAGPLLLLWFDLAQRGARCAFDEAIA